LGVDPPDWSSAAMKPSPRAMRAVISWSFICSLSRFWCQIAGEAHLGITPMALAHLPHRRKAKIAPGLGQAVIMKSRLDY
jgi:hypothetical protein